ncbi:TauD/TfdA-like domain containing protein [uncultured Caudovirales phage]|uniref:TauD/TfdA-like domain containing protein n=1 Tax=uncultured Caudovirales phage TaxID=2100421 RepID=A0A6J5LG47_9CAUD|nr:TauD/TfdA-like domain containing protein [uncultured Caudovirales phage]
MKITPIPQLGSHGVYIDDVDMLHITDEEWFNIGKLHLTKLVTIIRNTNLDDVRYLELMRKWGSNRDVIEYNLTKKYGTWVSKLLEEVEQDSSKFDEADLNQLRNLSRIVLRQNGKLTPLAKVTGIKDEQGNALGMFAEGELLWHSNEAGYLTFGPQVALLAHSGVVGSATGFVTTADWYQDQSESFRSELNEMIALHRYTPNKVTPGLNPVQDRYTAQHQCGIDDTEIPMVITSPVGIVGMHYSVNTVHSIEGMSIEESQKVFEKINKTLFTDKYVYDHWYQNNGDLCLFDNSITLHRRLGGIADRMCYRYQYDFSSPEIINKPYMPYTQPEYQEKYKQQITEIVATLKLTRFQLP